MMRPAPVDLAGRKCEPSEHTRSTLGAGPMFLEAPKNHQKKRSIFSWILIDSGSQNASIFVSVCTYFLNVSFNGYLIPILACFWLIQHRPRAQICWQGQYFHGFGTSHACFQISLKSAPKSSQNDYQRQPKMQQKINCFFHRFFDPFCLPKIIKNGSQNGAFLTRVWAYRFWIVFCLTVVAARGAWTPPRHGARDTFRWFWNSLMAYFKAFVS